MEGRIHCNPREASTLASYLMQAEFGNYDSQRHTAEYLRQCMLFPKVRYQYTEMIHVPYLTSHSFRISYRRTLADKTLFFPRLLFDTKALPV